MAENARSQFVWQTFMRNLEARRALFLAGFRGGGGTDNYHPKEKNKVPRAGSCGAVNQGMSP